MCIYLFIVDILKSNSDQNIVFSFCMNDSLPGCDICHMLILLNGQMVLFIKILTAQYITIRQNKDINVFTIE